MKKLVFIAILVLLCSFDTLALASSHSKAFVAQQEKVIFQSVNGSLIKAGWLKKGEMVQTVGETRSHYIIHFSDGYGYVGKDLFTPTNTVKTSQKMVSKKTASQKTLTSAFPISVYRNKGGKVVEVGKINESVSYAVIGDYGPNWYEINFTGYRAFIAKKDIKTMPPKSEKPVEVLETVLPIVPNQNIITVKETPIYMNENGTLKEVAKVDKGTRYQNVRNYGVNWYEVENNGAKAFVCKCKVKVDQGIPVLMYHHILTQEEKANSVYANASTTVTDEEFYAQMDYLKENEYETITAQQLYEFVMEKKSLPGKTVVLTFDDGINSTGKYAYPKLKDYGFKAIQFIISNRIPENPQPFDPNKLRFLSEQEMAEMSDVFDYGGHTHGLHNLVSNESDLLSKPKEVVMEDLKTNREIITDTSFFAYPFGRYNDTTIQQLKEVGFTMSFTTVNGRVQPNDDVYQLKRQNVHPGISIEQFASMIED
ncbi:polysaccharide deacetylase family protein [Metabacillus iocasae]|nr:polysaccharide deacetylase family protein [Metabacillus iocasae]